MPADGEHKSNGEHNNQALSGVSSNSTESAIPTHSQPTPISQQASIVYSVVPPPPTTAPVNHLDAWKSTFTKEDIHNLADRLSHWLYCYPTISQARFSKHVLHRTQGTLSTLLKLRCVPISRAGYEVWHKIRSFLNDSAQQDVLLNQYKWGSNSSSKPVTVTRESESEQHNAIISMCINYSIVILLQTNFIFARNMLSSIIIIF